MIWQTIWLVIILVSSGLLIVAIQAGNGSPGRVVITLWCLLVCPGMAYLQSLHIAQASARWILAIALSMSIDTLVSLALLYGGIWDYKQGVFIILAITWMGVTISFTRIWIASRHEVLTRPSEVSQ
ncbi:MAG: hypothetical protein JXB07_01230 [Anaerolineae bacterium]|nr:hypothetical protein [Anaerolineae bacterium]